MNLLGPAAQDFPPDELFGEWRPPSALANPRALKPPAAAAAAAILASSCHDVGHPGVNNNFLKNRAHALAVRC